MKSIGIIANPASGKDIRRLVSHATVVDNHEKINIVERIILAAKACGVAHIAIMPDTYQIGYKIIDHLGLSESALDVLDMPLSASHADSTEAARRMREAGVGCILTLGGDGTCRAVAKAIGDTPLIALSTGTNNAYPVMVEGTVAGIAAAIVAEVSTKRAMQSMTAVDKRIEIYVDGIFRDIALIDAVISKSPYVGAKAIWHLEDIDKVIVTKAHPVSIGFSAIAGSVRLIGENDDFGMALSLGEGDLTVRSPIAAGVVASVGVVSPMMMPLNEMVAFRPAYNGTLALDGEREIAFKAGTSLSFCIKRNGPRRVDVKKAIAYGHRMGFFNLTKEFEQRREPNG